MTRVAARQPIPPGPALMPTRRNVRGDYTLLAKPAGLLGNIFVSNNIPDYLRPHAEAVFSNHQFIWQSITNLFPEMRGVIRPELEVDFINSKREVLLKTKCTFYNGEERTFLINVPRNNTSLNLAAHTKTICSSKTEKQHTHRWGGQTKIKIDYGTFDVFSVDYHHGIPLNHVIDTLEGLVGIPGHPELGSIGKIEPARLERSLSKLEETRLITRREKNEILRARLSNNRDIISAFDAKLRSLIHELDQEAIGAFFKFWQETGYAQEDPRRNNIILQIGEEGERTYKVIDYEDIRAGKTLHQAIYDYAIFEEMVHQIPGLGRIVDASVRPWCWTYQSDNETSFSHNSFFRTIWNVLPKDSRHMDFLNAMIFFATNNLRIANLIRTFLVSIGKINPNPSPGLIYIGDR